MGVNFWGVVHGVPRVPAPTSPSGRRSHRQHRVDRRAAARASGLATTRSKHAVVAITEDLYHTVQMAGCRSASACCARDGCAPTSSTPTATGPPSWASAARRRTPAPTAIVGHYRRALDEGWRRRPWPTPWPTPCRGRPLLGVPAPGLPRHRRAALGDDRRARRSDAAGTVPGMPPRSQILAEVRAALGISAPS